LFLALLIVFMTVESQQTIIRDGREKLRACYLCDAAQTFPALRELLLAQLC
jgi:hypothetical protein